MIQLVKVPTANTDDLRSVPRACMVEGKNLLLQVVF